MTGPVESPPANADAIARLEALAREGREQQAAVLAREAGEARWTALRERREVERLGRANVRNALLDSPRGVSVPVLRISLVAVVAGTLLLFMPGAIWGVLGWVLLGGAIGGFFVGRLLLGRRYVRGEAAWLRTLPFPVRGYFRVLGETPSAERFVRVRVHFRHAAPEREVLAGLAGRMRYPATATLDGGGGLRWTLRSTTILTPELEEVEMTNLQVLSWMRGMITEVLLPLHDAYPLRSVHFDG